jgi:hypothetical protein
LNVDPARTRRGTVVVMTKDWRAGGGTLCPAIPHIAVIVFVTVLRCKSPADALVAGNVPAANVATAIRTPTLPLRTPPNVRGFPGSRFNI